MVICIQRGEFCKRLTQLRMSKGVSARDMSLSIWQSPNYIVDIEGGKNYPSMEAFFYICDFLGITPKEFFIWNPKIQAKQPSLWKSCSLCPMSNWIFSLPLAKQLKSDVADSRGMFYT